MTERQVSVSENSPLGSRVRHGVVLTLLCGLMAAAFNLVLAEDQAEAVAPEPSVMAEAFVDRYFRETSAGPTPSPRLKPSYHRTRYAELLDEQVVERRDSALSGHLVRFEAGMLTEAEDLSDERRCLAQAIYYEARGEGVVGQLAVADVVMNRKADANYPNTICGVVFQGAERRTGCQFSFTCDGSMDARMKKASWAEADRLAGYVMAGLRQPVTRAATHYHANYVDPRWASSLVPTAYIGAHVFYRNPTRYERRMLSAL